MPTSGKSPTMKDVAREAGVSLGTVSNVFNGAHVGREYRQRVEEAARRLGYAVNSYARGLRADRTNTVAVILPGLEHMFFARLANALCRELTLRGYRMQFVTTEYSPEAESACIQAVRQNMVDGIIGLTYSTGMPDVEGIPYVSIDRVISPSIPCVSSDNYGGGVLAAQTLLELGCRRPLFLRIGSHIMGETDKRGSGFLAECANQNVECTVRRFLDEDGPAQVVRLLDEQFLSGPPAYDGVFCSTDMLAVSVVRYLSRRGVRIPEDVQVIGYDGTREFFSGRYVCSTIVQPVQQMAEASVEIVTRWSEAGTPALISIPGFFVPGGTTRDGGTANGQ